MILAGDVGGTKTLLRYLRSHLGGHVSYERILSGDGLHRLYCFLRDSGQAPEPPWLQERMKVGDPNATISELALAGESPLCVATLDRFCSILGAEAGNLALRCLATSGIFVGGGIAPKILAALRRPGFLVLEEFPVEILAPASPSGSVTYFTPTRRGSRSEASVCL